LTAIPPGATESQALAFDTGPGNMVIDALMQELYGKAMDAGGRMAATGQVLQPVLERALRNRFFRKGPPKTAGREQFGREFAAALLADCRKVSQSKQDAIATATALTAASIAGAYTSYAEKDMRGAAVDFIASGGGARNETLMAQLRERLKAQRCKVGTSDDFGLPAEAKEAVAFALLAWQTWHRKPGNLRSATGASRPVVLGQVTYV
jgi:anhydro-N-acetylmuramic acid kinase